MDEKRKCIECGESIPEVRLQALPDTEHCVRCSVVKPRGVWDTETDEASDAPASNLGD